MAKNKKEGINLKKCALCTKMQNKNWRIWRKWHKKQILYLQERGKVYIFPLFQRIGIMKTFDQFSSRRDIEELFFNSRLCGEKESIASVESFIRGSFESVMVKSNPKRKVFRLVNETGRELYLKLFAPQKFPFNIKELCGKRVQNSKRTGKRFCPYYWVSVVGQRPEFLFILYFWRCPQCCSCQKIFLPRTSGKQFAGTGVFYRFPCWHNPSPPWKAFSPPGFSYGKYDFLSWWKKNASSVHIFQKPHRILIL